MACVPFQMAETPKYFKSGLKMAAADQDDFRNCFHNAVKDT